MNILFLRNFKWISLFLFIQFALIACATGRTVVNHHFSFDALQDSPGIEVLDYQYGSSTQFGTLAERERVALGQSFTGWNTFGAMPRGEFLYVKWRIKKTGQVIEDRVDLTRRLPHDIANSGIHFVVKDTQLYVYFIPPPGIWPAGAIKRAASEPKVAAYLAQHQIYPDQSKH